MHTMSDGNCLLHASLLGIWGVHDKKTIGGLSSLRAAMCKLLATPAVSAPLRERFLAENGRQNTEAGFAWDEDQEEAEWKRVLQEARTQNTFLRPVHVLAMACVLKRPIVMYSDTVTRDAWNVPIAPVPFFGIYLPFLVPPEECSKQPLVLVPPPYNMHLLCLSASLCLSRCRSVTSRHLRRIRSSTRRTSCRWLHQSELRAGRCTYRSCTS